MLRPMRMGVAIKAAALEFVRVTNENEAIPASAAGKAEIMMKGSSQDLKLTMVSRYKTTIENAKPLRSPT
jgi:hypothetical protein